MELSSLHTILKQEGTSQAERYLPALDPSYVKITEQTLLDQLRFAEDFSQFLVYLRGDGQNQGLEKQTWKNFFSGDPATLVARIANHDVTKVKLHYASIYSGFSKNPLVFNFLKLITYTGIWVIQLDDWLKASKPGSLLYRDLSLTIAAELSPKLIKLKEYYLATKSFGPQEQTFEEFFNLSGLEPIWGNLHKITAPDQTIFAGNSEEEKLSNAAIYINAIFEAFLKTVSTTVSATDRYLQDSLTNDATHAPHMALFLTFLQIFEYGQKQLNTLTKRHLDFYYQKFLQIPVRGPVADQATLFFTLAKGMNAFPLPALTPLIAGKDAANKQQTYLTDRELLMTHATVGALKTIFIDHTASVINGVYGAPVAASADGLGGAFKTDDTSWNLFGSASPVTAAETGFALASPQLFFKEGTRTISLDFQLNAAPGLTAESGQLDPSLFDFYLTSDKGWISTVPAGKAKAGEVLLKSLALTFPGDPGSGTGSGSAPGSAAAAGGSPGSGGAGSRPVHSGSGDVGSTPISSSPSTATLTVVLNIPTSTAKSVVGYTEKLHGGHYNTLYPVLKAVINYPAPSVPISILGGPVAPAATVSATGGGEAPRGVAPDAPAPMSRSAIDNATPLPGEPAGTGNSTAMGWTITQQRIFLQQSSITALTIGARAGMLTVDGDSGTGSTPSPTPGTTPATSTTGTASTDPVDTGIGGLNTLQAANDEGDLDTTKPFLPFTAVPRIGSSFYLNAPEFSNKPITNAAVYLEWMLPDNFSTYYQPYGVLYSDNNFQVNIDLLSAQVYQKEGVYDLFDPAGNTQLIELNELDADTFGTILDAGDQTTQAAISIRQKEGTLRLSLLKDFGNSIYPQLIVGSLMEKGGKMTLSPDDATELQTEMAAHPLEFTQDTKTLTQIKNITNIHGAPDEQVHGALSQALRLSLLKHNVTAPAVLAAAQPGPAPAGAPPVTPAPSGLGVPTPAGPVTLSDDIIQPLPAAPAVPAPPAAPAGKPAAGAIGHVTSLIGNFFRTGKFAAPVTPASSAATPTSTTTAFKAAMVKVASVNPTVSYVVMKETEAHLDYVSHLAAAQLLTDKTAGPVTEAQLSTTVNQILADQQPAYVQKLTTSTQDLLKVLSIPPPPYMPQLKSVQLAYDSSRDFSADYDTFYHVLPFGVSTQHSLGELFPQFRTPESATAVSAQMRSASAAIPSISSAAAANAAASAPATTSASTATPAIAARPLMEGQLLIGLSGIDPAQQLALFFQILDGSNAEFGPPPAISWSYLSKDKWTLLPKDDLISDTTYSFQNKGIIVFDLPDDMTAGTEQHDELNLLWLRASITGSAVNLPRISAVLPNAVTATFSDQGNSPDHYLQPLPAGTISKMLNKMAQVATLSQPVATAGGRPTELSPEYFTRVSERLRHKQRAVTNWDYEHLLLQQFPAVFKVKCLNNFFVNRAVLNDRGKFIPGHLSLVLIPDLRNQTAAETIPLQPRVAYKTLVDAETYLGLYCRPGVQVHAVNPAFDVVKVSCTVKFMTGLDNGAQLKKLNADLIGFLAPWTLDASADISFQVKIYASSLLDFIDKCAYVDYVIQFDMYCNDSLVPLVETTASTPFSIMVSAPKHDISYLES